MISRKSVFIEKLLQGCCTCKWYIAISCPLPACSVVLLTSLQPQYAVWLGRDRPHMRFEAQLPDLSHSQGKSARQQQRLPTTVISTRRKRYITAKTWPVLRRVKQALCLCLSGLALGGLQGGHATSVLPEVNNPSLGGQQYIQQRDRPAALLALLSLLMTASQASAAALR